MPESLNLFLNFAARLCGPLVEWMERLKNAAQILLERGIDFCERVNTRGGLIKDRVSSGSSHMAGELARGEQILKDRLERLFPAISGLLAIVTHPFHWVRQSKARGLAVAGILFALSLGIPLFSLGAYLYRGSTAAGNNRILLYDLNIGRLKAYPPGTLPGTDDTVSLMLYTHPDGPQPKAGMTLDDLRHAGLVVGWMYRLDPADWDALYASPDQPDDWISSKSRSFQAWMARRREAVQTGANDEPLAPCDVHVRDTKRGDRE